MHDTSTDTAKMVQPTIIRPTLILIRGLPGSGKTYIASRLEQAIGPDIVTMLDPDVTDYESVAYIEHSKALAAEGVEAKYYPYRFLRARAHQAIDARKIVIWNQPFTLRGGFQRTVQNLREYATERGLSLPILVVEVEVDATIAKQRVDKRKRAGGHGPDDEVFARFIQDYVSFADEGHPTVVVNGAADVSTSVAKVMTALNALWHK